MKRLVVAVLVAAAVAAAVVPALRHGTRRPRRAPTRAAAINVVYSTPANPPGSGTGATLLASENGAAPPLPLLRVFRRAATADDALPADSSLATLATSMPNVPRGALPDTPRARRLIAADGVALYAAPSVDEQTICGGLDPGDAWCSGAFTGGLMAQVETSHDDVAGRAYGVADDSVARVEIVLRNGARLHALLARNGFYSPLPLGPPPRDLVVTHRDGAHKILRVEAVPR